MCLLFLGDCEGGRERGRPLFVEGDQPNLEGPDVFVVTGESVEECGYVWD